MIRRVLITGNNSYIGNQLAEWLNKDLESYEVTKISVRDNKWKLIDFSLYHVVVHVAGIAHQDTKDNQKGLYYSINTDLTLNLAKKAKSEGVNQFVFMSSMIVYGASSKIGEKKVITKDTVPEPINFYGNSKLLAEEGILPLQTDSFNVVVVRPPMIYGENSKGNYPLLAKLANISPVFPDIENQRSMLHVDNLTEFIRMIIDNKKKGIYFPQNKEYVKTAEMVKEIATVNGKKILLTKIFNKPLQALLSNVNIVNKVFGDLIYEKEMSIYDFEYIVNDFKKSIIKTERLKKK